MKVAFGITVIISLSGGAVTVIAKGPETADDYHFFQLEQDFYTYKKPKYNEDRLCEPSNDKSCTKFCLGLKDDNRGRCSKNKQYCDHNKVAIEPCNPADLTQRFYYDGDYFFPLNTATNDPHLSYNKKDLVATVTQVKKRKSLKLRPYSGSDTSKWDFNPDTTGYGEIKTKEKNNGNNLCATFRGPHLETDDWLRLDYDDCSETMRQRWTELDTQTLCNTLCEGDSCKDIPDC